jgi:uridine kinase
MISQVIRHPVFIVGLIIRLLMIWLFESSPVHNWYAPFLDVSTQQWTIDPWRTWIESGGATVAFPYGYAMWIILLPITLLGKLFSIPVAYAYDVSLLVVDIVQLFVLHALLPKHQRLVLGTYWMSPITLLVTYVLGFNDLIAALFLTCMLFAIRSNRISWAGMLLAIAISIKLSMVVALPFVVIYLINNHSLRRYIVDFARYFFITLAILTTPYLLSENALFMLFQSQEIQKIYNLSIAIGTTVTIYVVPLIYVVMIYAAWRIKRVNFDLFHTVTGIAFLLIVLMTPAAPGWFIWSIPFLTLYQANRGRISLILVGIYVALYTVYTLITTPIELAHSAPIFLLAMTSGVTVQLTAFLNTGVISVGIVLVIHVWRDAISRNDFFRLSRQPFVIGIAGDSGAGKDIFADALEGIIGAHSVARVSGDDYHLWDRHKPMWHVLTHLNPRANDIEGFSNDVIALADGKHILSRHYNHTTGQMSRLHTANSNHFIIASGLHALYTPMLRECCDLRIYLDIDEDLRRFFKFRRDVHQRGHAIERVSQSFIQREPDSVKFIRSQIQYADLVYSLQPAHPHMIDDISAAAPSHYRLKIRSHNSLNELLLRRVLIGVCGLHVDIKMDTDNSEVVMMIEGETSAADMALSAKILCPNMLEFLDIQPQWQDGITGVMQLVTLLSINQALTKRFI